MSDYTSTNELQFQVPDLLVRPIRNASYRHEWNIIVEEKCEDALSRKKSPLVPRMLAEEAGALHTASDSTMVK